MKIQSQELTRELKDWTTAPDWNRTLAVTLTFPYSVTDMENASQLFRFFANRLNHRTLGRKFQRHGVALRMVPIRERGSGGSLHYHVWLELPADVSVARMSLGIKECWNRAVTASNARIDIQEARDEGWGDYIFKTISATNTDALDPRNTCLDGGRIFLSRSPSRA